MTALPWTTPWRSRSTSASAFGEWLRGCDARGDCACRNETAEFGEALARGQRVSIDAMFSAATRRSANHGMSAARSTRVSSSVERPMLSRPATCQRRTGERGTSHRRAAASQPHAETTSAATAVSTTSQRGLPSPQLLERSAVAARQRRVVRARSPGLGRLLAPAPANLGPQIGRLSLGEHQRAIPLSLGRDPVAARAACSHSLRGVRYRSEHFFLRTAGGAAGQASSPLPCAHLRRTSSRCQRSSVCGVTINPRRRGEGRIRVSAARKARSAGRTVGRGCCRRRTAS